MAQTNILLEVGTNELEIVEFYIQERGRDLEVYTGHYGVNVAKVLEIIRMPDVTEMPGSSHSSIIGAFKHRGRVLPLVDLSIWLGKNPPDQVDQKVIITEFNNEVTGFLVHGVNRIHRMSWESIEPPSGYVSEFSSHSITGVVKMDERIIFVLDLEKIVTELNPHMEMRLDEDESASIEGKYKALVADDSNIVRQMLKKQLEKGRFEVHLVNNGKEAWDLLEKIKEINPELPVIIMTAFGSVEKAVEAMQKGAYTFILKPFENEALIAHIAKSISMYRIVQENALLRDAVQTRYQFDNIIGKSKPMQKLYEIIRKVAPTNATVLIEGESGTGKEMVARSIHYNSLRKDHPMVAVNCAAFAESLLESELFGHEKGAFTGAAALKKGRFELADKGTLFLDEIGELSMPLQVKLLRVLQERTIERVGGTTPIPVDFRLIAATNKTLEDEVANNHFREDLYYRLNVVKAVIPPLRERPEDIPLLMNHFIEKFTRESSTVNRVKGFNKEAARILCDHLWNGNVRELENVIERSVILASKDVITPSDLPPRMRETPENTLDLDGIPEGVGLVETLAAVEKRMIIRAMTLSGNVQTKAARILGIGKSGLNQKLKKYNLDKELNIDGN